MKQLQIYYLMFCLVLSGCTPSSNQDTIQAPEIYACDAEQVSLSMTGKVFLGGGNTFSRGDLQSNEAARSGQYSCKLHKGNDIGMSCRLQDLIPGEYVEVSIWMFGDEGLGSIVLSHGSDYYKRIFVPVVVDSSGWQKLSYNLAVMEPIDELVVYGYNADTTPVYFDDLLVKRLPERPTYYPADSAINISVPKATLSQLDSFRMVALRNGVIDNSLKTYFDAAIFQGEDSIPIKLRIKGDWTDHLEGDKWSFRIKVRKGYSFNGLKSFSIQSPHTRSYLEEYVAHKLFEREDVLTTRYDFLPVKLNGKNLGLYAIEEHFDKQLVESKNRREGPILKLDEDGHWEKVRFDLNNENKVTIPVYRAAAILPFKQKRTSSSKQLLGQFMIAQNLLGQYKNLSENPEDLIDMNLMAKYYALMDICGIHHSIHWHNHRFYYNPITARLEPIAFDCHAEPLPNVVRLPICGFKHVHGWKNPSYENLLFYHVANNPGFQKLYAFHLKRFSSPDYLASFFDEIHSDLVDRETLIGNEFGGYQIDRLKYVSNAEKIRQELPAYEQACREGSIGFVAAEPFYSSDLPDSTYFSQTGLKAYLSSFADSTSVVEVVNFSLSEIEIEGYSLVSESDSIIKLSSPTLLSSYSGNNESYSLSLPGHVASLWFRPKNGQFVSSKKKVLQWPRPNSKNPRKELERTILKDSKYWTIEDSIITFKKNMYLNIVLFIPAGYHVEIPPGARILLGPGGGILSYSPVHANGIQQSPITINAQNNNNHGFQILSPAGKSALNWVEFTGMNTLNYKSWSLTGGVTFYDAQVDLNQCSFLGGVSEDALNLVRCQFNLSNLTVVNCAFDGFDADFCNGVVSNSRLSGTGNDGLDFSGSNILVVNCSLSEIGDKGISGGEASEVHVDSCSIENAEMGIVSKDQSKLEIFNTELKNCKVGLAAYQKKDEYGPAIVQSQQVQISETKKDFLLGIGSNISLDDSVYIGKKQIDVDSLYFDK